MSILQDERINLNVFSTQSGFHCYTKLIAFDVRRTLRNLWDPVVDGIPVHARREDSRFLVTWTGDVQNLRHFE